MATLNTIETAQAQDVGSLMQSQVTAVRKRRNELQGLLETWTYLKANHTTQELDAAFSGDNSGLTSAKIDAVFAALVAMGNVLDNNPTYQAALIALSKAALQ